MSLTTTTAPAMLAGCCCPAWAVSRSRVVTSPFTPLCTCTVKYSTVQYSTVHYSTVQYSTVQYSTVQSPRRTPWARASAGRSCSCPMTAARHSSAWMRTSTQTLTPGTSHTETLQTKLREDFTITEKPPFLVESTFTTSVFIIKTLC